jgi:hypothetical protein
VVLESIYIKIKKYKNCVAKKVAGYKRYRRITVGKYVHSRVKALLEETSDAFEISRGSLNTDYSEFATMAFADFQVALKNPSLTRSELLSILREAIAQYKQVPKTDETSDSWASFVASCVEKTSNLNDDNNSTH